MAAVRGYWLEQPKRMKKHEGKFKGCIFQHIWREACLTHTEGLQNGTTFSMQHMSFLTKLLLDCLLSHRFDAALECLVGLCGACKKIPELFWRTGCEVLSRTPGSDTHMKQFFKSMFVLCGQFKEEVLLDYALYLIKHNSDFTEAREMLTAKMHQLPFVTNHLLRGYLGLLEFLLWKKGKLQLDKKQLEAQDQGDSWGLMTEDYQETNLKRQMDFHAKKALSYFHSLVESIGVWDMFIVRQVELLKYYNRTDEGKKVLERYREKNSENPNAHRYLYYFLKTEKAPKEELCSVLKGLLAVDPTSELSEEYIRLTDEMSETGSPDSLHNTLQAVFNKLDHAASRQDAQAWETLVCVLCKCNSLYRRNLFKELWSERADWWPQFHFRPDLVPAKSCVTELEWKLNCHKAEVARCLLGERNRFTVAVRKQEAEGCSSGLSLRVSTSPFKHFASPRKRKRTSIPCESSSSMKKRNQK